MYCAKPSHYSHSCVRGDKKEEQSTAASHSHEKQAQKLRASLSSNSLSPATALTELLHWPKITKPPK